MYNAVKSGNAYDYNYKEFVCDTLEDLQRIRTKNLAAGSKAVVLKGEDDKQQSYILTNGKEWIVSAVGGA